MRNLLKKRRIEKELEEEKEEIDQIEEDVKYIKSVLAKEEHFSKKDIGISFLGALIFGLAIIVNKNMFLSILGASLNAVALMALFAIAVLVVISVISYGKSIKCQKFSTDLQSVAESQCHSRMRKISEHAQEPPDVADHSNIPPVYDWRFLTETNKLLFSRFLIERAVALYLIALAVSLYLLYLFGFHNFGVNSFLRALFILSLPSVIGAAIPTLK